jgi:hypothetical protein
MDVMSKIRRLTDHERYIIGGVAAMFGRDMPSEPETPEELASAVRIVKSCERIIMQLTKLFQDPAGTA